MCIGQHNTEGKHMSYAVENFHNTFIKDGAIRWSSNGRCLPKECVDDLVAADLITVDTAERTTDMREIETVEFFAEYRRAQKNRTAEQIQEERMMARGAMGAGVQMINCITGERYTT
jgi:hypothetical protein